MKEIFPIESVTKLSPRLEWMKKYELTTYRSPGFTEDEEPWSCWSGDLHEALGEDALATAKTEDDAILAWAKMVNVPMWHEEGFKK